MFYCGDICASAIHAETVLFYQYTYNDHTEQEKWKCVVKYYESDFLMSGEKCVTFCSSQCLFIYVQNTGAIFNIEIATFSCLMNITDLSGHIRWQICFLKNCFIIQHEIDIKSAQVYALSYLCIFTKPVSDTKDEISCYPPVETK